MLAEVTVPGLDAGGSVLTPDPLRPGGRVFSFSDFFSLVLRITELLADSKFFSLSKDYSFI